VRRWRRPGGCRGLCEGHRRPADAGHGRPHVNEAALLHLANQILATREHNNPDEAALALLDPMSVAMLELEPAQIADIRAEAEEGLGAVIALFFPPRAATESRSAAPYRGNAGPPQVSLNPLGGGLGEPCPRGPQTRLIRVSSSSPGSIRPRHVTVVLGTMRS
jgi:hypothetical protein